MHLPREVDEPMSDQPIATRLLVAAAVVALGVWLGNALSRDDHPKPAPFVVSTYCSTTFGLMATWSDGHVSPIGVC